MLQKSPMQHGQVPMAQVPFHLLLAAETPEDLLMLLCIILHNHCVFNQLPSQLDLIEGVKKKGESAAVYQTFESRASSRK